MTKVLNHTEEPLCTLATFMMDDFTFPIFNFSLNSSNIPASPADEAYISQLYVILELVPSIVIF